MWLETLRNFKKESGKTNEQIAVESVSHWAHLISYLLVKQNTRSNSTLRKVVHCLGHTIDDLDEKSASTEEEARIEDLINSQRGQALLGKYSMLTEPAQDRVDATVNDIWSNPANRIDQQFQAPEPIIYTTAASGGEPGLRSGTISVSQEELDKQWREAQMAPGPRGLGITYKLTI